MLTREQILGAADLPEDTVPTPEWASAGAPAVRVRTPSGETRDAMLKAADALGDKANEPAHYHALWCVAGVVCEDGTPMFTWDDVARLVAKNVTPLERIARRVRDLFKGHAEGNSGGEPTGASASDASSSSSPNV